jgi:hypothetical protein
LSCLDIVLERNYFNIGILQGEIMKTLKVLLILLASTSLLACVNQAKLQKERELAGANDGKICRMEKVAGKLIRERICYTQEQIEKIREASQRAKDNFDVRGATRNTME